MPRMRDARRSGWNGSSASVFSPTPRNLIGLPVTKRTDSAAPPRASPSVLGRVTPRRARNILGLLVRTTGKETGIHLGGQLLELLDGRRAVDVGAHQQHRLLLAFAQQARQLGGTGG